MGEGGLAVTSRDKAGAGTKGMLAQVALRQRVKGEEMQPGTPVPLIYVTATMWPWAETHVEPPVESPRLSHSARPRTGSQIHGACS